MPTATSLGDGRRCVMMSEKIRPHHLERKAILYVRQSSAHQVLHNRESSALQYATRDRLLAPGCSEIEVIDDAQPQRPQDRQRQSLDPRARHLHALELSHPGVQGSGN